MDERLPAATLTGPAPAIDVRGLSLAFQGAAGPVEALRDVSLSAETGTFVSLVGPSGSGKSTLLRVLAGLLTPSSGQALVKGQDVIGRHGAVAFMPQRDALLPWRRALDNATLGATIAGISPARARANARSLLHQFGLDGFERAWPAELSGGMRQRLALLRTFLMPRDVLLLDEPFGALDAITRRRMYLWLESVWEEDRRIVLFVTHDVEEALLLSDRVLVMSPRPGRIVADIEVLFPRPRTAELQTTAEFTNRKRDVLQALGGADEPARGDGA